MALSETWFLDGYIDFELQKYKLLAYLRAAGTRKLSAQVLVENTRMRAVGRSLGFTETSEGDGLLRLTLDLTQPPPATPA